MKAAPADAISKASPFGVVQSSPAVIELFVATLIC